MLAFCRTHLSAIKCPRSVDFADELPRLPTGKLLKRLLRERYWAGRENKLGLGGASGTHGVRRVPGGRATPIISRSIPGACGASSRQP
ncbi:hypothetical protein ACU4GD_40840 [Cupriavidus basilensis]